MSVSRNHNYNLSAMMNSPPLSDGGSDRIDRRLTGRSAADARMEGISMPFESQRGPTKENKLNSHSALTSIVKKPTLEDVGEDFDIPQRFTKSGRKKAIPFPLKLLKVLSQKEYTEIITWLPDGKSFTIIRPKAFVAEILPDFFKSAKYSSFTRKLHRWGFQRHLRGEDAGAFFHKHFIRGRLDLVERMTCHKDDGTTMDMKQTFIPRPIVTSGGGTSFRDAVARDAPSTTLNVQQTQFQLQQQLLQLQQMQEQLQSLQQLQQQNLMLQQHDQQPEHFRGPVQQHQAIQAASRQESKDGNSVDRLNAAIELEVSRRLNGRIQAAASDRFVAPSAMPLFNNNDRLQLSRQALAMNLGMPTQTSQFNVGSPFPPGSFSGMQNLLGGHDIRPGLRGDSMMDSDGSLPRF